MSFINARENLQKPRQGNIERQSIEAQENLKQQRSQVKKLKQNLIMFLCG